MINLNNYYFAGPKAILYNLELDHDFLGFYINNNQKILTNNTNISEIGIKYKKSTDSTWTLLPLINYNDVMSKVINNGTNLCDLIGGIKEETDYIVYYPVLVNYVIKPYRIVIKNLLPETTYNIASYYIQNNETTEYNTCTVQTLPQRTYFTCGTITGEGEYDTPENIEKLTNCITKCCDILSSITSWGSSYTETKIDAKVKRLEGAAADNGMNFNGPSYITLGVAMHELAHNYMLVTNNADGYHDQVVKFMEFATYTENADWRWITQHNYPVISSADYNVLFNYYVAAACHVSHYTNNS